MSWAQYEHRGDRNEAARKLEEAELDAHWNAPADIPAWKAFLAGIIIAAIVMSIFIVAASLVRR